MQQLVEGEHLLEFGNSQILGDESMLDIILCSSRRPECSYYSFCIKKITCPVIVPCSDRDVRISGGDGLTYGRFEVCISGVWGSVCSDRLWDNTAAGVACKELGFSQDGMI